MTEPDYSADTLFPAIDGAFRPLREGIRYSAVRDDAETALRMERERLALALTAGQMGVYDLCLLTDVLWWSPEIYKVFGVSVDTFTPTADSFTQLLHPDDREPFWTRVQQSIDRREYFVHEFRLIRPDGRERWIGNRAQTEYDAAGKPVRHFGVAIDITERKRAEIGVRQSAELFATLIEQAPIGTYVIDSNFRIQQVNAVAMPSFSDIRPLIGRDLHEALVILWGAEIADTISAIFRHTLETGERYVSPRFIETRHDIGVEQSYEWEIQRLILPDGKYGVVCYFNDITPRYRAQQALQESEERARLATDATGVGIWEWNVLTNTVWWDAQMFRIYGIEPKANGRASYEDWCQAVLPEDLAGNLSIVNETVRCSGTSSRHFRIRRRSDGAVRHIECVETTRVNDQGQTEWVVGTNLDVTERKLAEAALIKSERFNMAVLDSLPAEIAVLDHQGKIIAINKPWMAFSQDLADTQADRVGVGVDYLAICRRAAAEGDDVAQKTLAGIESVITGDAPDFKMEYACHAPDRQRWFALHVVRAPAEVGGAIVAHTDVTERRMLEELLVSHAAELAEADRSKDEFLAMLAHELRNPLAPLRNTTEILKTEGITAEEEAHALGILTRQIENMSRMIDDLLDVSRITQGKIELRKKQEPLEAILTAAANLAKSGCSARGQHLTLKLPERPIFLDADATRLEQVLGNLLSNASKYSGSGTHITLSAERKGGEVIITVSDDGVGIDPQLLPRIFDLFVQASRTLDREHGGLGIGLTLAQRLVKLHGGSIEARSDGIDRGAQFHVRLPILASAPIVAPKSIMAAAQEHPRRILIVDDNADSARSLALLHRRRGHVIQTAFTGPDAVAAAAEFLPEVVILDIGLPGMDGYEVARRLRALPELTGAFMVAMSGYGSPEDIAEAKRAGFDEYLVKPMDLHLLRDWLRALPVRG